MRRAYIRTIELAATLRRELVVRIETPSKIRSHIDTARAVESMHICCAVPRRYIPQSDDVGRSDADLATLSSLAPSPVIAVRAARSGKLYSPAVRLELRSSSSSSTSLSLVGWW
jgi:hypothetical protein